MKNLHAKKPMYSIPVLCALLGKSKQAYYQYNEERLMEYASTILKAVDFYNNVRPHMSLDMMTPVQAARMKGPIKKLWYSYREQAIQNEIEKVNAPSSLITENCLPLATSVDCAGAVNRT